MLCFVGFVVVFALSRGPGAHDGGPHAASRSAVGFAALAELLRTTGTQVVVSQAPRLEETPQAALLVLTPPAGKRVPVRSVYAVPARTVLLVLPKWRTDPLFQHPGWVSLDGLQHTSGILDTVPRNDHATLTYRPGVAAPDLAADPALRLPGSLPAGPIDRLQLLENGLHPLLTDISGGPLLTRAGKLYILSDPDLLNNQGLATPAAAETAIALLSRLADGGTVAFDLSLNDAAGGHDPLRAMFEPPLLGATLCALAAAGLLGLLAAVRFGPARQPGRAIDLGKAALAANSAALLLRAGRQAHLARPYAALITAAAARALRLPARLPPDALTTALDRVARQRNPAAEPLPALLEAASAARRRADLLPLARRLHAWKDTIDHAHR